MNRQHNGQMKKDKQRSTKHTYKTKDRATRTPLKTGGELMCSGSVSSSCSTCGTRHSCHTLSTILICRFHCEKIVLQENFTQYFESGSDCS